MLFRSKSDETNETNNSNLIQSNPAFRIPHYYGQFALFLGKESPYIFSKFNTDTFCGPSVSVLMRFDCLTKVKNPNWSNLDGGQTSWFVYKRSLRQELGTWGSRVQRSNNSVTLHPKKRVHITSSKKVTASKWHTKQLYSIYLFPKFTKFDKQQVF